VNLCKVVAAHFKIGRASIAKSLFPETVLTASGFALQRPASWA
jgi:hypothetical protein